MMAICCPGDEQSSFRLHLGYPFFLMLLYSRYHVLFHSVKWLGSNLLKSYGSYSLMSQHTSPYLSPLVEA